MSVIELITVIGFAIAVFELGYMIEKKNSRPSLVS